MGLKCGEVKCDSCNEKIQGRAVKALGKHYHPEHLLCTTCKAPILTERFYEHEKKPYCAKDYEQFQPKCHKCKKTITGTGLKAKDKSFHEECFLCEKCSAKLSGKNFFLVNDQFLCDKCRTEGRPKCAACNKPIETEDLEALGKHYHPKCFVCSRCKKAITTDQFSVTDKREPVCSKCANPDEKTKKCC